MKKMALDSLPVAIVGGGPVGLAAAAHLAIRGVTVKVYEAGSSVASNMRDWGHIKVFTPWQYCIDTAALTLLQKAGWTMPDRDTYPTGNEIVSEYLEPLAVTRELIDSIEFSARVTGISRLGMDKTVSRGRQARPFVLNVKTANGSRRDIARAVIDASGTWATPNPLGANGLPADGETAFIDRIAYGIPDILGKDRETYAGRSTLVVGTGHSAANALLDLTKLAEREKRGGLLWATRSTNLARVYGGGEADGLKARAELGIKLRHLVEAERILLFKGFAIHRIREAANARLWVDGEIDGGAATIGPVDRIIAATGQRPDLSLTRELRLELDPWLESVKALGPLIDPNQHSCGSVPPHGYRELAHIEPGFFTVGIKSYGRAPTFLLLTGYEQVRSVAAAMAGDQEAAESIELVLPETGVCSTSFAAEDDDKANCCATPSPQKVKNCCASSQSVRTRALGQSSCGTKA